MMKSSGRIRPSISGHMSFTFNSSDKVYGKFEDIFNLIKEKINLRWEKSGFYTFSGGVISHLHCNKMGNGNSKASLRFLKAKPYFLDNLTCAIQQRATDNTISCSIKGNLDFEKIKLHLENESDWFAESDVNFIATQNLNNNNVRITAYPKISILNLMFEFKDELRDSNLPSEIIRNICKIGGGKI